jgi:hypothetical protein
MRVRRHPARWSRHTRPWSHPGTITLNTTLIPTAHGTFHVDPKGNVVPTPHGGRITSCGRSLRSSTGLGRQPDRRPGWMDRTSPPTTPIPRAQQPDGHVPGVSNPDGTPWLPINR